MAYNLFISHKHSDGAIARVVADFIETKKFSGRYRRMYRRTRRTEDHASVKT